MATRSGTVKVTYDGKPGSGSAREAVREALNVKLGVPEREARAADAENLQGLLDRRFGGKLGGLAAKMSGGKTSGKEYLAARRQLERVLDGSRKLTPKAAEKIAAVSDKRLKETKAIKATQPRSLPAPLPNAEGGGGSVTVTMSYSGEASASDEDDREREFPEMEFEYDPETDEDPFATYLADYGYDHWSGEGEVHFTIEDGE